MTEPTKTPQPTALALISAAITKMTPQFEAALPANIPADKFVRTVLQGIQTHKDQAKLANADRKSLYLSCQKAAADGLVLDGREAALVVFYNKERKIDEVQYMPMTQGLVKLARNSGEIANIGAWVVHKNDKFTFRIGIDDIPVHEADWFGTDRGDPVGVWALVTLSNGEKIPAILPKSKIMTIAGKSKNGYQYNPESGSYYDEWWKKTAIKNVLKYAPKSSDVERALQHDDEEYVVEQPAETTAAAAAPGKRGGKRQTKAAAAVKGEDTTEDHKGPAPEPGKVIDAEFTEAGDTPNPPEPTPPAKGQEEVELPL